MEQTNLPKIFTIGDSHSYIPFLGIPEITTAYLGPITLKRIGHPKETLLKITIDSLYPSPQDVLIFCFGEIDVRCWVKIYLNKKNSNLITLISSWVDNFFNNIQTHSHVAILGITPPTSKDKIDRKEYPVAGSDQERVLFTRTLNAILKEKALLKNFSFIDVSKYEDDQGMLKQELSDGTVHIDNSSILVNEIINELSKIGIYVL